MDGLAVDMYAYMRRYAYRIGRQTSMTQDTEQLRKLNNAWDTFVHQFNDNNIKSYIFTSYLRGCMGNSHFDAQMNFTVSGHMNANT